MKIGIVGDSHDNLKAIEKSVSFLNSEKVDYLLHTGDMVSPFSAKLFLRLNSKSFFTFGNNDGERLMLKQTLSESENCNLIWPKSTFTINKYRIVLTHGEDEEVVEALGQSGAFDLIAYGHWHRPVNKKIGNCLVVNPGELCGYLSGRSTLAIVDMEKRLARIIEL